MEKNKFFHLSNNFTIDFQDSMVESRPIMEHYHDACEIAFFLRADIKIFICNKQYDIKDGDLIFMNEYEIHKILYSDHMQYTRYVINFKRDFIESTLKSLGIHDLIMKIQNKEVRRISTNLKHRAEFEQVFKNLLDLNNKFTNTFTTVTQAKIKLELIRLLIDIQRLSAVSNIYMEPNKQQNLTKDIIDYIDSNFMNEITLDMLERNLHLSKYYISHVFKSMTGFTVVEYIQNRRIIEAQKMLVATDRDIIRICYDSGFNNIQHFSRVFRKITGSTPYKYRNKEK